MLYNQPYGISDPDAAYINGNPSTGVMGSIPPAASIEHPQREIVNFITKSALTPTAGDLYQLAKAVQMGLVNYGLDQGAPNDIQITPVVPIASYHVGQRFVIKMGFGNTSQCTVNVSALGKVPLIHTDLTPMNAYELIIGQLIEVAYDGTQFQLTAGGAPGGIVTLSAPQTLYVSDSIGSDTLYDGTSPVIAGVMGGPFKTIQKALATMKKYNLGGWNFTIMIADGIYNVASPILPPIPNGSGQVILQGNVTNPQAVQVQSNSGSVFRVTQGGVYYFQGLAFIGGGTPLPGDNGCCLDVAIGTVNVTDCRYGNAQNYHLAAGAQGWIYLGPSGTQYVAGNAPGAHMFAVWGGKIVSSPPALPSVNIQNAVSVGKWAYSADASVINITYQSIVGAGNVTGQKYTAIGNGMIDTAGNGVNYLPGTVAGSLATGGQYI